MITFEQPLAFNLSPSPTTTSSTTTSSSHLRSVSFSSAHSDNGSSNFIKPSPSLVSLNRSFRRPPVILKDTSSSKFSNRFGEVAGGTAADCAAICCCWPCGLLDLLVTAAVKLPAGLVRRAYRKRRRRRRVEKMRKAAVLGLRSYGSGSSCALDDDDKWRTKEEWGIPVGTAAAIEEFAAMENEMWSTFHGTGFWRSPSQREREDP